MQWDPAFKKNKIDVLVMDREIDQMYEKSIILGVKKNRYFIPFYMKSKVLCGTEQVLYLYIGVLKYTTCS